MGSASVRIFQLVIAGAAAAGVPPPALVAAAGLEPAALADPDGRLPRALETRIWQEAARLAGDDAFGLHLAERNAAPGFGALGYALRSSATLGDAYARLIRFVRVAVQGPVLSLELDGPLARLRHTPPAAPPPPSRHGVEYLVATLVEMARQGVDREFRPRAVSFRHAAPAHLDEHHRVLGPRVQFGADRDELVIERARLARPQREAEPALASVLDGHLASQLAALPTDDDAGFLDRARAALAAELDGGEGEPALGAVAARLHMSRRSLQRRLQVEGSSLSALLDRLRAELAVQALGDARESIGEVAFRLGFADVTTFHRAFKRWTGVTPATYRRDRSAAAR